MIDYTEQGASAEPQEQQGVAPEPQRESSIQKLKRERRAAFDENAQLRNELSSIRDEIRQLREATPQKSSGVQNRWEDLSEAELWKIATDNETASTSPAMMANALYHLQKKQLAAELSRKADELKKEIFGTLQRGTATADIVRKIKQDFGEDALQEGSELFDLADAKYRQELQRYGESVRENPMTMYRVVREAKEQLDALNKKPHPTKPVGPPPEERSGGTSENAADRIAEQKSALTKGDWRGALRSVSRGLFADMNSS